MVLGDDSVGKTLPGKVKTEIQTPRTHVKSQGTVVHLQWPSNKSRDRVSRASC